MGERDAFGREKGQDSLGDMGWTTSLPPAAAPAPPVPPVFDAGEAARPFSRAKAPEPAVAAAPPEPPPAAAAPAEPPPAVRRGTPARPPAPARPRRGPAVGRLIVLVAIVGVLAVGGSAAVRVGSGAVDGIRDRIDALASPEPATPTHGRGDLLQREAGLRAALAKLPPGKVVLVRIDSGSLDAQVIGDGRRHIVHIQPGAPATDVRAPVGADQPGFRPTAAAPLRLVRTATRRNHQPAREIDHVVGTDQGWVVVFKDGTRYRATPAGRHVRRL